MSGWFGRRRRPPFDEVEWQRAVRATAALSRLTQPELERVRDLTHAFSKQITIEGCRGVEVDGTIRAAIAGPACAMVRELGLGAFRLVRHVLVYPDEFRARGQFEDEFGVVTEGERALSGEAWSDGPVIVSWRDVQSADASYHVVIHEFAHKIDMLTGDEDGVPPLPDERTRTAWVEAFDAARERLARLEEADVETSIDPYAAESPAEAFAVFSEVHFQAPSLLALEFPDVHDHLERFYGV